MWADQQGLIYISSVQTLDAVKITYQERWMTGTDGERVRQGTWCCQCDLMMILEILVLVWFYGISTIVGYFKPNPFCTHTHTHIYKIYDF